MIYVSRYWPIIVLVLFAIMSLVVAAITMRPLGVCPVEEPTDLQLKTIATLTDIVDLGLKLSTALVGFGAAALIGIKAELKLSRFMRVMIVVSVVLFAQSALYGVWWRFSIAQIYLIECLSMVTAPAVQLRFQAHVYLFMLGICAVGVLVVGGIFKDPEKKEEFET